MQILRIALLSVLGTSACAQLVANGDEPMFNLNINQQNINNNQFPVFDKPPKTDDSDPINDALDTPSVDDEWDLILDAVKSILSKELDGQETASGKTVEELLDDLSPEAKEELVRLIRDQAAAAVDDENVRERTIERLHKHHHKHHHHQHHYDSDEEEALTRVLYNWSTNSTIGIQLTCSGGGGGTRGGASKVKSQLLVAPGSEASFEIPCCKSGGTPSLQLWDQEAWASLGTFAVSKDPIPRIEASHDLRLPAYEVRFNQPISGDIRIVAPKPKPTCPVEQPELGAPCSFEGKCSYGQETCCDGTVHPNMVVQCGADGIAVGMYTDACMMVKCEEPPTPPPTHTCPLAAPEPGSKCGFPGARCKYGQETCCDGSVHHNFIVQCSADGFAAGFYTDVCKAVQCEEDDVSTEAPSIAGSGANTYESSSSSSTTPSPTPLADVLTESPTEFMPQEECPLAMPELGTECAFDVNCYYGEELCCDGKPHPNMAVQCSEEGKTVGYYTDACFAVTCSPTAAPTTAATTTEEPTVAATTAEPTTSEEEEEVVDATASPTMSGSEEDVAAATMGPTTAATASPTTSGSEEAATMGPSSGLRGSATASPTTSGTASPSAETTLYDTAGDSFSGSYFGTKWPTWVPTTPPTFWPTSMPTESTNAPTNPDTTVIVDTEEVVPYDGME